MGLSADERYAMLLGFYRLEQLGASRLPELAHFVPEAGFKRETLAHAADEARHEEIFRHILDRLPGDKNMALAPPHSLGTYLIEQALSQWQGTVTAPSVLSVIPVMVYILASEERAVISFSAHARCYSADRWICSAFEGIVADEKQHVKMIRRRLEQWRREDAEMAQAIEAAEIRVTSVRERFLKTLDR